MAVARADRTSSQDDLSLAEYVCLALFAEGSAHGWAIAKELERDGPLGRIWTLSKPNTYRTIDALVAKGLIQRLAARDGAGPAKVPLQITPKGRRTAKRWLERPIDHVRHVRSELLLKLTLLQRSGIDLREFCVRQRDHLQPTIRAIQETGKGTTDPVELWRREQATAAQRFLELLTSEPRSKAPSRRAVAK